MDTQHGSDHNPAKDLGQMTTWSREAHAMLDAGAAIRQVALVLPVGSNIREDMLGESEGWLVCARLRGLTPTLAAA